MNILEKAAKAIRANAKQQARGQSYSGTHYAPFVDISRGDLHIDGMMCSIDLGRAALEAAAQEIEAMADTDDAMAWQWQEGMRDAANILRGISV